MIRNLLHAHAILPLALTLAALSLLLGPPPAAAQACSTSADCDDGLFCNGVERCVFLTLGVSTCFPGTPVACDDGIACSIDLCDEDLDRCVNVAPDMDGDGVRDATCRDADGVPLGQDCDDRDPNRFPGNREVCDAEDHDEDCNAETFGEVDADGDGYPDDQCCNLAGFVPVVGGGFEPRFNCGSDCDDTNIDVHPSLAEVCNGIDDNCRDGIDEGLRIDLYLDRDGDGHGDPLDVVLDCPGRAGRSPLGNDCDDFNAAVRPGAVICDTAPGAVLICEEDGTFVPASCDSQSGSECVGQPNGTGLCLPSASNAFDLDADGVLDLADNCPAVNNPSQADADGNGFGDACECGDVSGDGRVNSIDARLIQRHAVGQLAASDLTCAARP